MINLNTSDFNYDLQKNSIAIYPCQKREKSKLLIVDKDGIHHQYFNEIDQFLPSSSTLFFNDTKVISARLQLTKKTGAAIDIMLLNPIHPTTSVQHSMQAKVCVLWQCTVKNIRKWREGSSLYQNQNRYSLTVTLVNKSEGLVSFRWQPQDINFGKIINIMGYIPLPPYINRQSNVQDKKRYQTVYSIHEGGVAAPTAGLHFSEALIQKIQKNKIPTEFLTLHISGGTFQPIKTENIADHQMHTEQVIVTKKALKTLLLPNRKPIAVGTTSMRVLESLYWFGVKLLKGQGKSGFYIEKTDPYQQSYYPLPVPEEALKAVEETVAPNQPLIGQTSIFIFPGYSFKVCKGLITNLHLPKSTPLLLVAAFIGNRWREVYQVAVKHNYRFLSYGDSMLLIPPSDKKHHDR